MTDQHPITPPPELVHLWRVASSNVPASLSTDPGGRRDYIDYIATKAAQWGADIELEACCEWLEGEIGATDPEDLRIARRSKPPSLKEQALEILPEHPENMASLLQLTPGKVATIRRALEALDD